MKCSKCHIDQPEEEFYLRRNDKTRRADCRTCCAAYRKKYRKQAYVKKQMADYWRNGPRGAFIIERKTVPCFDCKKTYPYYVMDFDHRDAGEKLFEISQHPKGVTLEDIKSEIDKCDVVCANCHRERTFSRRGENTGEEKWTEGFGSYQRNKTHCPQGHEYTPENTYVRPGRPGRNCRTCMKEAQKAYNAKRGK